MSRRPPRPETPADRAGAWTGPDGGRAVGYPRLPACCRKETRRIGPGLIGFECPDCGRWWVRAPA